MMFHSLKLVIKRLVAKGWDVLQVDIFKAFIDGGIDNDLHVGGGCCEVQAKKLYKWGRLLINRMMN